MTKTNNELFDQSLQKVYAVIAKTKSSNTLDKAISIWDSLMKGRLKSSTGAMSRQQPMHCLLHKSEKGTLPSSQKPDGKAQDKDERPISPNAWRVKMPDGKIYAYKMALNGSVTRHEVGEYKTPTYTLEQYRQLHDHIEAHHKEMQEKKTMPPTNKAELKKALTERDQLQKAAEPRRWGQTARSCFDPLAPSTRPAPAAMPKTENRPLWGVSPGLGQLSAHKAHFNAPAPRNGYEAAAVKAGVDVSKLPPGTDLTRMNRAQMVALGQEQARTQIAPTVQAHSRLYRG